MWSVDTYFTLWVRERRRRRRRRRRNEGSERPFADVRAAARLAVGWPARARAGGADQKAVTRTEGTARGKRAMSVLGSLLSSDDHEDLRLQVLLCFEREVPRSGGVLPPSFSALVCVCRGALFARSNLSFLDVYIAPYVRFEDVCRSLLENYNAFQTPSMLRSDARLRWLDASNLRVRLELYRCRLELRAARGVIAHGEAQRA